MVAVGYKVSPGIHKRQGQTSLGSTMGQRHFFFTSPSTRCIFFPSCYQLIWTTRYRISGPKPRAASMQLAILELGSWEFMITLPRSFNIPIIWWVKTSRWFPLSYRTLSLQRWPSYAVDVCLAAGRKGYSTVCKIAARSSHRYSHLCIHSWNISVEATPRWDRLYSTSKLTLAVQDKITHQHSTIANHKHRKRCSCIQTI